MEKYYCVENQPTCRNKAREFRCVSVWMWMLQAWSRGGSPSLSSPARVNLPWALGRILLPSTLHLSSPIVWACLDKVIHSIQYLHTWSTAHRAHSDRNSMHQPLRNAAVTLQTQRGKVTAGVFHELVYERVISHSATPLDVSGWAKSVHSLTTHARRRVMMS